MGLRIRSFKCITALVAMALLQCFYVPQSFGASSEPGTASNTTRSTFIVSNSTTESSSTALKPIVDETGLITLSLDSKGVNNNAHENIRVNKPSAGATVKSAYLATTDVWGLYGRPLDNGIVELNGNPITWDKNITAPYGSHNAWADVTSIVKPIADAAPKGIINVDYTEKASLDGSILAVIFNDPAQTVNNSVVLLFGAQNITGDTFNIGLANPVNKNDPKLAMDFSLGISYGCQPSSPSQYSIVNVNGKRLTSSAGGQDDGFGDNGGLITVGGIGDSNANPPDPNATPSSCRYDDELYNLLPFINDGDTKIAVDTVNPSNDDNIFFAGLSVSSANAIVGEGIILDPVSDKGIIGNNHTVTATLQDDNGNLLVNKEVKFNIISGPNKNKTTVVTTGSNGKASFTYTSLFTGIDTLNASFTNSQSETVFSNQVQMEWSPSNNSVASVRLNKTDITLACGGTEQLVATVSPSNATNKNVTWTSSDSSIASVDSTGLVTAVSQGKNVKITVNTTDGNFQAYCYITVTDTIKNIKILSADPSAFSLSVDEQSDPITLTAAYADGSSEDVTDSATWTSKNPSVATVDASDESVTITGVASGWTRITGTYGGKIANICVEVSDGSTPELVNLLVQPESVSVFYGKTQAVKIYSVYSDDSRVDVTKLATLVSEDPTIATVTGGIIRGISVGQTSISVTYTDPATEIDQTADIPVTVTPPVTKLTADPTVLNLLVDGSDIITLMASYKDGTEGEVTESATWKSSKPKIATVDVDGTVTGIAIGTTTITGTFGGKTATINVNVTPELDYISVQPGMVGIAKGKTQAVTIYAVFVDGSKVVITKTIRLTSDDPKVASVTGATIKGLTADYETTVRGTYLDQDIEIPVKVTQPLKTLVSDTAASGLNLSIDDCETINLTATYADGTSEDVNDCATFLSSKPSIATVDIVDGSITVTGVAPGSTTITLSYQGKKVTVKVKVTA